MDITLSLPRALLKALRASVPAVILTLLLLAVDVRLHHDLRQIVATLAIVPTTVGLLLAVFLRGQPRRIRLNGDVMEAGKQTAKLVGPSYLEHSRGLETLVVPTDAGPITLLDVYTVPLGGIRDALNLQMMSPSSGRRLPSLPTSGNPKIDEVIRKALQSQDLSRLELRDLGRRWVLSPGWLFPMLAAVITIPVLLSLSSIKQVVLPTKLIWDLLFLVGVGFVLPWAYITVIIPTRRIPRWALITSTHFIVINDWARILPLAAVKDVVRHPGVTYIEFRNGSWIQFPDEVLEVPLAAACGLAPDRHITIKECAGRMGCSRFRASFALGKLVERPNHIHREAFERFLSARHDGICPRT